MATTKKMKGLFPDLSKELKEGMDLLRSIEGTGIEILKEIREAHRRNVKGQLVEDKLREQWVRLCQKFLQDGAVLSVR